MALSFLARNENDIFRDINNLNQINTKYLGANTKTTTVQRISGELKV